MKSKKVNLIKKIFSIVFISLFIFSNTSSLALAQLLYDPSTDINFVGDIFQNQNQVQPPYKDTRSQKDAEAAKADAERLKQLHEQDRIKCQEELGGVGIQNKLGPAIKEGLKQTMKTAMEETLPNALKSTLQEKVGGKLSQEISDSFARETESRVKNDLATRLPQIMAQLNSSGQTVNRDMFRQIFEKEFRSSIEKNYKLSLYNAFREGTKSAVKKSIEEDLPSILDQTANQAKPNIEKEFPKIFRNLLGTDMFGYMSDEIHEDADEFSLSNLISSSESDLGDFMDGNTIEEASTHLTNNLGYFSGLEVNKQFDGFGQKVMQRLLERNSSNQRPLDDIFARSGIDTNIDSLLGPIFEDATDQVIFDTQNILVDTVENTLNQTTDTAIDSIFNTLNRGGNDVNLDASIEALLDTSPAGNALGSIISDTTNSLTSGLADTLSSGVDSLGVGITGTLTDGIDSLAESITGPLTNSLSSSLGPFGDALGGVFEDMAGSVLDPIKDKVGDIVDSALDPIKEKLGQFTDKINEKMTAVTDKITGKVTDTVKGKVVGAAAGVANIFVPVQEKPGTLISNTKQVKKNTKNTASNTKEIDKTTKNIEQLDIEICTKNKAIERMLMAEEQERTVSNPQLKRDAATQVEDFRNETLDFAKKGYDSTGQGADSPLYVQNLDDIIKQTKTEARQVFYDDLKQSGDSFKDQTLSKLKKDEQSNLKSDITTQEYNNFTQGKVKDNQEWWRMMFAVTNPFKPNSPESSYKINQGLVTQRQVEAEQKMLTEITASQGYLPVRDCVEFTADGQTCRRWETVTPAIQVKESVADALSYRLDLYSDAEPGDVAPGNEPMLDELRTFTPSQTGGGNPGSNAFNIGSIISLLTNFLGRQNENQGGGNLTFTSQIENSSNNTSIAKLTWSGKNIANCRVTSDWLGRSSFGTEVNRPIGSALASSGTANVPLPLGLDVRFIRTRNNVQGSITIGTSTPNRIADQKTLTLPTDIQTGDTLTISFFPHSPLYAVSVEVGTDTSKQTIINNFQTAIRNINTGEENPAQKAEIRKYLYNFNPTNGSITITPNTTYSLECTDNVGKTIPKSVTLRR